MRVAVLVEVAPGNPSGTGVALGRLLAGRTPRDCVVIVSANAGTARLTSGGLPVRPLPPDAPAHFGRPLLGWRLLRRARRIFRLLRQERVGLLLACSGDLLDPPAGMLAAHWAGIPYHFYAFDDYRAQPRDRAGRLVARLAEPRVVRAAAGLIVPNEFERDTYERRYGVPAAIVRNPHPYSAGELAGPVPSRPVAAHVLRFTGSVYGVNADAFRALLAGMAGTLWRLELHTAQTAAQVAAAGVVGPVRVLPHLPEGEALAAQRAAGALYLPLGHGRPVREVVRSAAPGKLGEYLASGRPVLAHVPEDSFVAWYLRRHRCGLVVTRPEPAAVTAALRQLAEDGRLVRQMTEAARHRAREDFAPEPARAALSAALGWG